MRIESQAICFRKQDSIIANALPTWVNSSLNSDESSNGVGGAYTSSSNKDPQAEDSILLSESKHINEKITDEAAKILGLQKGTEFKVHCSSFVAAPDGECKF